MKQDKELEIGQNRENAIDVATAELNGVNVYCFKKDDRGEIFLRMTLNAIDYLTKREEGFKNVKSIFKHDTTIQGDKELFILTKVTVKDIDSGIEKVFEGEELFNKVAYIFEKKDANQERLTEIENKIPLLKLGHEEEREFLQNYLFAEDSEKDKIYSKFLAECI